MYGLFLINPEGELAFAQFGSHVKIEALRLVRDARLCVVIHSGGLEEMFTTEQPPPIVESMERSTEVLVAHIDDAGKTIDEYLVCVERVG